MNNKNGFTIIELIVSLRIIGVISLLTMQKVAETYFLKEVNRTLDRTSIIISHGVTDITKGYVNGTGGMCSTNYNYDNISAYRVNECYGLNYELGGNYANLADQQNGNVNYFMKLMKGYTFGDGVTLHIDEDVSDNTIFYTLFDCSNLDKKDRKKSMIEEMFISKMNEDFALIVESVNRNRVTMNLRDVSGTENDCKVLMAFKK